MKRISYLIFFLLAYPLFDLKSQEVIKNSAINGICYAGTNVNRIYIPPPEKSQKKGGNKGKPDARVTFYLSGFTAEGRSVMQKVETILEMVLPPGTNLTIVAKFERITTSGVLAFSSATGFVGGWGIDALEPMSYYPVGLAEKIIGQRLNADETGDVELTINSTANWYYGIDGVTPTTRYDLVTVALHEVLHGLGFFDSMGVSGSQGSYNSIPVIYDTFIENDLGYRLTDTTRFENNTVALKNEMTGGKLYFRGPVLSKYSNSRSKVWAPETFDPGSSIAHLDENKDFTAPLNSLMTPYIALGEAIHDPGFLTNAILADLGWINTRITHVSPRDTEEPKSQVDLTATIESDTSYNRNNVGVVYSFDNFINSDTVYMTSLNSDNNFKASLNIPSYNKLLQYYIYTEDYFHRIYRTPSLIKLFKYSIYIGVDTIKPIISHTKAGYYLSTVDTITLKANAADNIGMDSVYIEYKVNEGVSKYIGVPSKNKTGDYKALINVKSLQLKGGDSIRYRIFAVDTSLSKNTAVLPKSGYFSIGIEGILSVVKSYETNFVSVQSDFFNQGFSISKPSGFSNFGLHSVHPYVSPEESAPGIEYVSMLRHPLKMEGSGMLINYNEVVLVEPGEPGAPYGSADFFDYVVVEASSDFGKKWFPLADGYDSRYNPAWEVFYNNSIVDQISTATGDESMLKKHTIFYKPTANISDGDTMIVRFRLFSDPYANGWGWVIENLSIRPLVDAVEKVTQETVLLYPNPGKGIINLTGEYAESQSFKPVTFSVFNMSGTCLVSKSELGSNSNVIDISEFPEGFYIIVLYRDDGIKTFRYTLIR